MNIGKRATWYAAFIALRVALERRGKYDQSKRLYDEVVFRITTSAGIAQRIENVRIAENIPRTEVYGDE